MTRSSNALLRIACAALALGGGAALAAAAEPACAVAAGPACAVAAEPACAVATSDFCVCCPPSDCRKQEAFCPGEVAGLLVLEAENPECAVNPYEEKSCRSGGVIASERRSAVSVHAQGQSARIDLSTAQLQSLVGQLRGLGR